MRKLHQLVSALRQVALVHLIIFYLPFKGLIELSLVVRERWLLGGSDVELWQPLAYEIFSLNIVKLMS